MNKELQDKIYKLLVSDGTTPLGAQVIVDLLAAIESKKKERAPLYAGVLALIEQRIRGILPQLTQAEAMEVAEELESVIHHSKADRNS
jgi:hypothetical protein